MSDIMKTVLHRRSIRRFENRPVEKEKLEEIVQAGLYAPSAGGRQGVYLVVSSDAEKNLKLGRMKRANMNPSMAHGNVYVSKEQPSIADDAKITNAFYDAPVVITLFGRKDFLFAKEDCACAAMNMMLVSDEHGIGSCYLGQGWLAFQNAYGQEVLKEWKIPQNYYAVAQLVLGYPREGDRHPVAKPRKEGRVYYV